MKPTVHMDFMGSTEPEPHPLIPIDTMDYMIIIGVQTTFTAVPATSSHPNDNYGIPNHIYCRCYNI